MPDRPPSVRSAASRKVRVPDHVLVQELDGESVLLNLETELYLGLNESGTRILRQLSESESIAAAYDALLERYEVEPERLRAELDRLLEELFRQGIIELAAE